MSADSNPSPRIEDHALIGDCRTAALVTRDGVVNWLCLPHFSDPSVFAALLDEQGGHFAITPIGPFRSERRYLDGTAVLETVFETASGRVRLRDLMPIARGGGHLEPQRELLRLLEGLEGEMELAVEFVPRPGYGRWRFHLNERPGMGWVCAYRSDALLLCSDIALHADATHRRVHGRVRLRGGVRHVLSLCYADEDPLILPALGEAAAKRCEVTAEWWRRWSGRCVYRGPHAPLVHRSMITLKLLTHTLSGALIAAPTTSLPESEQGMRNWDYRFCWLRDAARTIEAFESMGYHDEAAAFMGWLLHATRLTRPELQVVYHIFGESRLQEMELPHLAGYGGARPVRIGNGAWNQLQLDVYGEVVQAAWYFAHAGGELGRSERSILRAFGEVVCKRWNEPDQGIWEIRGEPRHHTYSKLMCWVALHCLLALEREGHMRVPTQRFAAHAHAIRSAIEQYAYNPALQAYTGMFDSDWPDASLLLMPRYGFETADAPRQRTTYAFLEQRLGAGPLFYRYPPESDGMPGREGTFAACAFWAVDHLARANRLEQAQAHFDALVALANDVGLFAEEYTPDGRALGNFPQAFTHAAVITAALALQEGTQAGSGPS